METHAHGNAFVAGTLWHYFRGVHPADRQYAEGEEVEEEESEGYEEPQGLMDGYGLAHKYRERKGGISTTTVPIQSMTAIMTIQNEHAPALDISTLRRPAFSIKK